MIRLDLSSRQLLGLVFLAGILWTVACAVTRRVLLIGLRWRRRRFADHLTWDHHRRIARAWMAGMEEGRRGT